MAVFHDRPGVTLAFALLPLALVGGWLVWLAGRWTPVPATHDAYLLARVLFSEHLAADDGDTGTRFHAKLPDGTRVAVATRDLARAMAVVDTACVERLVEPTGRPRYRLAWPEECE